MRRAAALALALALVAVACSDRGAGPNSTTLATGGGGGLAGGGFGGGFVTGGLSGVGLHRFDACDDMLAYIKAEALERVGPWGLNGGGYWWGGPVPMFEDSAGGFAPTTTVAASDFAGAEPGRAEGYSGVAGQDYSTTNVQEAGIDEPDIVKTDGERIFAVAGDRLYYVTVGPEGPAVAGSIRIENGWGAQLLLAGDRLLVMSTTGPWALPAASLPEIWHPDYYPGELTYLAEVDVSDPASMRITRTLTTDGRFVSARLTGTSARAVVSAFPVLEFVQPAGPGLRAQERAEEVNRQVIEESTLEDWVPYYVLEDLGAGTTTEGPLLGCADLFAPIEFSGFSTLTVLTIDLARGLAPVDRVGVFADGETVYASATGLYVASTEWVEDWVEEGSEVRSERPPEVTTEIHKFDITDPAAVTYRTSGSVPGYLLNQYSLSEHDGYLRVATTTGAQWGWGPESESLVSVLAEGDDGLVVVGQVGDLGRGEQIYAVRFIGDRGYVVTFRQIDPLYAIDLSVPTAPKVTGELKIQGYSAYLHPLGDGLLLGVGQDATLEGRVLGTQVSVFDTSDPASPVRLHNFTVADASSEAEYDPHAFLHWPATGLTAIPLSTWSWDEASGTESWFTGLLGLTVGAGGIDELGRVTHGSLDDPYGGGYQIRRSLVIGDRLFTVSELGVKASSLTDLSDLAWLSFS